MKKLLIALLLSLLATPAMALPWSWDMSVTDYSASGLTVSGDILNFPFDVTTSGGSTILQTLTGGSDDTILDDGDTFSELGFLTVLGTSINPPFIETGINFTYDDGTGAVPATAYIEYSGLAGSIYDHNDGGTLTTDASGIVDDTFKLNFTPGVGDIKFYLDTNTISSDGALELASLKLLSGTGTSPIAIEGWNEGQFNLTAGFIDVLDDFWTLTDSNTDFEDWMSMYGIPSVFASSFNLGATLFGEPKDVQGGIELTVANEGSFVVTAVPETSTFLLLGGGLIGLGLIARRRKQQ